MRNASPYEHELYQALRQVKDLDALQGICSANATADAMAPELRDWLLLACNAERERRGAGYAQEWISPEVAFTSFDDENLVGAGMFTVAVLETAMVWGKPDVCLFAFLLHRFVIASMGSRIFETAILENCNGKPDGQLAQRVPGGNDAQPKRGERVSLEPNGRHAQAATNRRGKGADALESRGTKSVGEERLPPLRRIAQHSRRRASALAGAGPNPHVARALAEIHRLRDLYHANGQRWLPGQEAEWVAANRAYDGLGKP